MLILGIDTSGKTASVALCNEDTVLAQSTVLTKLTHSQVIMPVCQRVLDSADIQLENVDVIACAKGPGSYTGLRIGIAAVKAMCYALDKKCCGVSVLESLAFNFYGIKTVVCSVMHARLNLVYGAVFVSDGTSIKRITNDAVISIDELDTIVKGFDSDVMVVGDYACEYIKASSADNLVLSPPHLRLQLASSLCYVAYNSECYDPSYLNADYLQITKAEKDRCV